MNAAKQILERLIEDMSESEAFEVIDYISYLKSRREKKHIETCKRQVKAV